MQAEAEAQNGLQEASFPFRSAWYLGAQSGPVVPFHPWPLFNHLGSALLEVVKYLPREGCRHTLTEDSLQLLIQILRWRLAEDGDMPPLLQYQPVSRQTWPYDG